ncbi:MAG: TIGR03619 family F420-dependent LLM class oxidoreductase [Deltaproteobacteria bacterium]|nr:TIGR03619 family F420-dependent LLM class oxidoreductase [Deltaproteobacteria bacterium]
MKFGLHYSLGVGTNPTIDDYIRVAQQAEALGYRTVWVGDHIVIPEQIVAPYPYTKDGSVGFARNCPWPDPFVLLAALGVATKTILLGTSVIIVPYRNPLHVAKAVATVDLASHGRYQFGVGIGWLKEEFDALGEQFSERAARTREYLQVMKAMWAGETASFQGKYFSFPTLHTNPIPVQRPHPPIIFGGESMPALKRIADLGNGWQPGPIPVDVFRTKRDQLQTLMAERGRKMSELSISMIGGTRDLQQDRGKIAALEELGVSEILLFMMGPTVEDTLKEMEEAARTLMR